MGGWQGFGADAEDHEVYGGDIMMREIIAILNFGVVIFLFPLFVAMVLPNWDWGVYDPFKLLFGVALFFIVLVEVMLVFLWGSDDDKDHRRSGYQPHGSL